MPEKNVWFTPVWMDTLVDTKYVVVVHTHQGSYRVILVPTRSAQ